MCHHADCLRQLYPAHVALRTAILDDLARIYFTTPYCRLDHLAFQHVAYHNHEFLYQSV